MKAEAVGEDIIKKISNACFSAFVLGVLIVTVIAVTYQPPDPWLQSAPALTKLLSGPRNATFKEDSSITRTGEDFVLAPSTAPGPVITEASIQSSEKNTPPLLNCSQDVNCSDPRVLFAIQRFNLRLFKNIVFLNYSPPVNASKPNQCDVAWKFRNRKDRSWRKFRDFRRFRIGISDDCTFKVVGASGWHSGVNARRPRISRTPAPTTGSGDSEINDTIPTMGSDAAFRKGKYLYYSRGGDYCKGMNQYMWSFLCALGEAHYLNRTLVMDLSICLSSRYNPSGLDEEGKDFRFYFDFEHLKQEASILEEREFLRDRRRWERTHNRKIPTRKVATYKTTPMQLKNDTTTILWRLFDAPEPDNYWYRVCEGQAATYIHRPWHALWKSKRLMNIVSEISGRMDWDFDTLHVVRGEKAQNKQLWPHLDADTSPDALVAKLQGVVQPWRNLYVATNEPFYNYFDKLRSHYHLHLLDDYKELWGNTSDWYNQTMALNDGRPVTFDGYMRVEIDTEVFIRGKTRVETFYNLTSDCKDGINTC